MQRFFEASTWAGFAAILQAAKVLVPPQYHVALDGATAVTGVIAGMLPEHGGVK
jgi:hypothetical protein